MGHGEVLDKLNKAREQSRLRLKEEGGAEFMVHVHIFLFIAILLILVVNHDKQNMNIQDIYLDKAGSDGL